MVGFLFFHLCAGSVRANVYATDLRVNGSFNPAILLPGNSLTISYVLNDTATGGVWLRIYSGANIVKTFASTNGAAGTNAGLNSVIWDGTTDVATNAAEGAYTVSITAASGGYQTWTNITDDSSNFSVLAPRGISVNQNTNSPYYGRVYVADAHNMTEGGASGIFKYNANGSPADEGGFSTGGWGWGNSGFSPWKMAVGPDDRLYVDDFSDRGVVLSFDPTIDSGSLRTVIGTNNYPVQYPNLELSGLALTGTAANMRIWMTDEDLLWIGNPYGSAGIIAWQITADGIAATNDTGDSIVPVDADYLTQAPYDLALDTNGFIYTIQLIKPGDGPAYALMKFPPYAGHPETIADWAVGMYPLLVNVYGVAVDPTATFVAVAVLGESGDPESGITGGLYLFSASNEDFITDLDQTGGHAYYDAAWDNVGNLYALDGLTSNAVWRVYSPPGTNQATTVAVPVIQAYDALLPPSLCSPMAVSNGMHFTLCGQSNVTYVVQRSCDLTNWTAVATNYSAGTNRPMSVPIFGRQNFYRAVTAP